MRLDSRSFGNAVKHTYGSSEPKAHTGHEGLNTRRGIKMFEVILGFAILFSLFAMAFNAEGVAKWWKRVPRLTKVSFGLFVLAWIMWATGEGTFAWIPQDPSTYNLVFPAYFTAGKIAAGLGLAILITSLFLPVRRKR